MLNDVARAGRAGFRRRGGAGEVFYPGGVGRDAAGFRVGGTDADLGRSAASLASSYTYVVGAGGAGGSAGTFGYSGGAGSDGRLIIEEYWQ